MMEQESLLTDHDRDSALWQKLAQHFEGRLQTLRMQNDAPKDEHKTALLRGRIAQIKELLALGTGAITESDDPLEISQ